MRKPSWLQKFVNRLPGRVEAVKCSACGRWCVEDRTRCEWERYDAGIIAGDDLAVAIVCERPLVLVEQSGGTPSLRTVCGETGISVDGQYLAAHSCRLAPISDRAWQPPNVKGNGADLEFLTSMSTHPDPTNRDPWARLLDLEQPTLID